MTREQLERRFAKLEGFLEHLAARYEQQRKLDELNKEIAQQIIGLPYYWGEWSGVVIPANEPTKVFTKIKNMRTGEETHWKFDALYVYENLQKTAKFNSWEEYHAEEIKRYREDMRQLLTKYNYPKEEIEKRVAAIC